MSTEHSPSTLLLSSDTNQQQQEHESEIQKKKEKQELRKIIRRRIKELTLEQVHEQSVNVWKQVFQLPIYQSAQSIGVFLSMPNGEINTDMLIQDCVRLKKDIYVPEVGKNFERCDMVLRKVIPTFVTTWKEKSNEDDTDQELLLLFHKQWPQNKWKIPEPPKEMPLVVAQPGDLDLVIMPGLGFDRSLHRLGQGKGYYDRFIARMTQDGHDLPLLAVALTPQLVEDELIPVADYDKQMDMIVLPNEIIGEL